MRHCSTVATAQEWRSLSQHLDFLLEQASETTFFRSKDFVMMSDEHLELCRFTSAAINSLAVVFGLFMATFYGGLLRPPGTDGVGGKPALFVFLLCNSIGIAFSMAGLLARYVFAFTSLHPTTLTTTTTTITTTTTGSCTQCHGGQRQTE